MTDKVLLVTVPDDVFIDGVRILLVDLKPEHTQLISDALQKFDTLPNVITYIWRNGDDPVWLLDKKLKSDLIIFDAESENQLVAGYIAAQKQSHYFGFLRNLAMGKDSAIYTTDDCFNLIKKIIEKYE